MRIKNGWIVLLFFLSLFISGCDQERNQLIKGFFATSTPIPPTATATALPTATATPLPTPLPEYRVDTAETYLLTGDYDRALQEYERTLAENPEEPFLAAAIRGEAQIQHLRNNHDQCIQIITDGISQISNEQNQAALWFLAADCYQAMGNYREEIEALQRYSEINPGTTLTATITEREGNALYNLGQYPEAAEKYLSLSSASGVISNVTLHLKLADAYDAAEDTSGAIQTWLNILDTSAATDQQKAQAIYRIGETYLKLDEPEQAYARFQELVNLYPRYYESYSALLKLLDNAQSVSEFQRGLVNYYRGQYSLAAEAFNRYVKSDPGHDGTAYYYIGVSQMYIADYDAAIISFQRIIDDYPKNRFYVSAWDEKAYIQSTQYKKPQQAAQTLLDYVKKHPDQPDAASFLYEAGRILERGNKLNEAAVQWERLIDEYPLYEKSNLALFLAGISRYRKASYDSALATFNRLLLIATEPEALARVHFWIAKTYQKKGEAEAAERYFRLAADNAPSNYYSERATEILDGTKPLIFSDVSHPDINLDQEARVADQWMQITFNLAAGTDLENPSELLLDANYNKANELWNLGYYQEALNLFETVRLTYATDALNSYRLLKRLIHLGAWRPAVFTSRQILTLAGLLEDVRTFSAPNYFNHIRYGVWYPEIVSSVSETYGIHPFILYALMRQESMYDPWISSAAGAQGLMQIMPATGNEIARYLHWPSDYTDADLLRAIVAVNFSGYYLNKQFHYFDQNPYYMLASYNAGPGNAAGWIEQLEADDPDLFMEVIPFEETRTYIKQVYEFANLYERFYSQ